MTNPTSTPDNSVMQALLPCPFCGGLPTTGYQGDEDGGYGYAECNKADHFVGSHMSSEAEAIAAWNTRLSTDLPRDDAREALTKCRDKFRDYEALHLAKIPDINSPSAIEAVMDKVLRNREMADMCDAVLSRPAPEPVRPSGDVREALANPHLDAALLRLLQGGVGLMDTEKTAFRQLRAALTPAPSDQQEREG
jgi:hypothetical protein